MVDTGTLIELVGVNEGMMFVPLDGNPIDGLLLFHSYKVFSTNDPVRMIGAERALPQIT
jgi:hypothetical protein